MVTHATPKRRDIRYEPANQRTTVPITVHQLDGTAVDTLLVLTPDELQMYAIQLEQAIEQRRKTQERAIA
ncbi:hypothetical protein [Streptomyces alboflavus]|uniref:hypothetical protein n=1 Tax=Streptomyces alboflavus TaxID=67267 RepID=UPI0036CE0635